MWFQEKPGFRGLQLQDLLLLALRESNTMRILLLLWQKTHVPTALSTNSTLGLLG